MPSDDRLRSIVPMFGGATRYVETLDAILDYVRENRPTTDELVGWHRGAFDGVSSRNSIMRRVEYLEDVGYLLHENARWELGREGELYMDDRSIDRLVEIMCRRNLGLRSLLYALSVGPMSIEEVGHQQLKTHPELGWDPDNYDMALQRVNWLRSLGLIQKDGDRYELTENGREFTDTAVEQWADFTRDIASAEIDSPSVGTYETTVTARAVDPEFRETALANFDRTCPVSGVDHPALLDVAHILSWAEYPAYRGDLQNVLPLSKLHHAAFDRELFTVDGEYRLRVHPEFETESRVLRETLHDRAGEKIPIRTNTVSRTYLRQYNENLEWV